MSGSTSWSAPPIRPLPRAISAPIVTVVATPDGKGYWEAGVDGAIYQFR